MTLLTFLAQLAVVLAFIFLGAKVGGLGIGLAGGAGVIILGLLGCKVDPATGIPWEVVGIIMSVICAVAVMEKAGGLDVLVAASEKILRANPQRITYVGPIVTFIMTVLCGTGNVAFAVLPVIAEVAKEQGIRPSKPLAASSVASQMALVASPISAATVIMAGAVEPMGISYPKLVAVTLCTTFVGCMAAAFVSSRQGCDLQDDPVYQQRKTAGKVHLREAGTYHIDRRAKLSLGIFLSALGVLMVYAVAISKIDNPPLPRGAAIMCAMLGAALLICLTCKVPMSEVNDQPTFKAGMSAATCIIGVAWLGNCFVASNMGLIKSYGADALSGAPWLLAVVFFLGSTLLYSQAATLATFLPAATALGVGATVLVASYSASAALFVLPTYPTTVASIELDDTGSTRIGSFIFNHPFLLPGLIAIVVSVLLGYGVLTLL